MNKNILLLTICLTVTLIACSMDNSGNIPQPGMIQREPQTAQEQRVVADRELIAALRDYNADLRKAADQVHANTQKMVGLMARLEKAEEEIDASVRARNEAMHNVHAAQNNHNGKPRNKKK